MQNFISPNRNAKDISKEANKTYGRTQKISDGTLKKMQTLSVGSTHPFNPLNKSSQFVKPAGASPKVLKKYNR